MKVVLEVCICTNKYTSLFVSRDEKDMCFSSQNDGRRHSHTHNNKAQYIIKGHTIRYEHVHWQFTMVYGSLWSHSKCCKTLIHYIAFSRWKGTSSNASTPSTTTSSRAILLWREARPWPTKPGPTRHRCRCWPTSCSFQGTWHGDVCPNGLGSSPKNYAEIRLDEVDMVDITIEGVTSFEGQLWLRISSKSLGPTAAKNI